MIVAGSPASVSRRSTNSSQRRLPAPYGLRVGAPGIVLAHRDPAQRVAIRVDSAHQQVVLHLTRQQAPQFLHPFRLEAREVDHRVRPEFVQGRLHIGRSAPVAVVEPHRVCEPRIGVRGTLQHRQPVAACDQFLGATTGDVPRTADEQHFTYKDSYGVTLKASQCAPGNHYPHLCLQRAELRICANFGRISLLAQRMRSRVAGRGAVRRQ